MSQLATNKIHSSENVKLLQSDILWLLSLVKIPVWQNNNEHAFSRLLANRWEKIAWRLLEPWYVAKYEK